MANLARSAVTFNEVWTEGKNTNLLAKDVTCVLTAQGDATDKILASVLGFSKIMKVLSVRKSDNSVIYFGCPSNDGSFVLLGTSTTPATITATVRMIVIGRAS